MMLANISDIDITDYTSWQDKIFLTFDIDWCSDEVLEFTLDIVEKYDIPATFFVTHETPLLQRMRENPALELGIHPNFNFLLEGDFRYGRNYEEVIEYYLKIVPEAKSARSHSMTQNTPILQLFEDKGLQYDCNTFIPYSSYITLKPYKHFTGNLTKVPYFWEDDVHCLYGWDWDVDKFLKYDGIKVFDFHPIHIFLNTNTMQFYEDCREFFHHPAKLEKLRNTTTYGVYNFLIDTIRRVLND